MRRALGGLFVLVLGCSSSSADESKPASPTRLDMATWCPADGSGVGEDLGILPVPKRVYEAGTAVVVSNLRQEGADEVEAAEIERIAEIRGMAGGEGTGLTVVMHEEQASQELFARCGLEVTEGGGAHVLVVGSDGTSAEIIAPDPLGRFHALQTLQQLLVEEQDGTTVRPATIYDAPSQARRGVLEGFYGTPWGDADRVAIMEALADLKLNYYAYAPKEDDKINKNWQEPFDDGDLQRIRDVVKAAKAQRIEVCWEIHTGVMPPNLTSPTLRTMTRWSRSSRPSWPKAFRASFLRSTTS